MPSDFIKKHLEELKTDGKFNSGFIDILINANESGQDGKTTAAEIIKLIKIRYAKNRKNKA